MFVDQPADARRFFWQAWRKRQAGTPLEPLEAIVVRVIEEHPEYHPLFAGDERQVCAYGTDLPPEENPFLHIGLHLALHEQLQIDRPVGVRAHYQRLKTASGAHRAEHLMMSVLADVLWAAQRNRSMPDEGDYLARLRQLE
jgi:Domain of unknown function (DUF1841)